MNTFLKEAAAHIPPGAEIVIVVKETNGKTYTHSTRDQLDGVLGLLAAGQVVETARALGAASQAEPSRILQLNGHGMNPDRIKA